MSNTIPPVQSSAAYGPGSFSTATLTSSKQTAFVERDANQFSATVPGPTANDRKRGDSRRSNGAP
jgi:hypothetical protein